MCTWPTESKHIKYPFRRTGRLTNTYTSQGKARTDNPSNTIKNLSPCCMTRGSHHYRQRPHPSLSLLFLALSLAPPRTMQAGFPRWLGTGGGGEGVICRLHNVSVNILIRWWYLGEIATEESGMFAWKWCKCFDVFANKKGEGERFV